MLDKVIGLNIGNAGEKLAVRGEAIHEFLTGPNTAPYGDAFDEKLCPGNGKLHRSLPYINHLTNRLPGFILEAGNHLLTHHPERITAMTVIVTPLHIFNAIETIKRNPTKYLPTQPLPTTPGRRKQRILAAGRDAIAAVLFEQVPGTNWGNLTKAIRKGCGPAVVFEPINKAGAEALGLLPTEPQFLS